MNLPPKRDNQNAYNKSTRSKRTPDHQAQVKDACFAVCHQYFGAFQDHSAKGRFVQARRLRQGDDHDPEKAELGLA